MRAERAQERKQTPTPQLGVAGRSGIPSPGTHTHTAHPSQEWRLTSGALRHTPQHPIQECRAAAEAGAQTHPPTTHTLARSGGVQAEHAHKHTHTPTSE